jgi:hypothetical protein
LARKAPLCLHAPALLRQGVRALAKISATAAPMKPKKGAVGGHSSSNGMSSIDLRE